MNNKLIQTINYGSLSFSVFEEDFNNNKIKKYSITKKVWDNNSKTFEKKGNIGLNKLQDLSLIKWFLKNAFGEHGDKKIGVYGIQTINNKKTLFKSYIDKTGAENKQLLPLETEEILQLIDLIDRILAINIKPVGTKLNNDKPFFNAVEDDDIPF